LLKCPGNLNIGNEFVNVGSEYLLRQALEQAGVENYNFYVSEFWATCMVFHKYQSDWNTKGMKELIDRADLVVVSAGSLVSPLQKKFLEDLSRIKAPVILLGAGMLGYTKEEEELARQAFRNAKLVVCRDALLFDAIRETVPAVSGLDMAFFVNDAFVPMPAKGEYAVVNVDFDLKRMGLRERIYKNLKKKFETVYLIENTSTMRKHKDFVFLSRWSEFCNLYANAAFVSTMRIHTSVICTIFQTPFEYLGNDCEPNSRRSALFRQIGMPLEKGKQYIKEMLEEKKQNIEAKKREVESKLTNTIKSILA